MSTTSNKCVPCVHGRTFQPDIEHSYTTCRSVQACPPNQFSLPGDEPTLTADRVCRFATTTLTTTATITTSTSTTSTTTDTTQTSTTATTRTTVTTATFTPETTTELGSGDGPVTTAAVTISTASTYCDQPCSSGGGPCRRFKVNGECQGYNYQGLCPTGFEDCTDLPDRIDYSGDAQAQLKAGKKVYYASLTNPRLKEEVYAGACDDCARSFGPCRVRTAAGSACFAYVDDEKLKCPRMMDVDKCDTRTTRSTNSTNGTTITATTATSSTATLLPTATTATTTMPKLSAPTTTTNTTATDTQVNVRELKNNAVASTKAFSEAGCSSGSGAATATTAEPSGAADGCVALKLEMDIAVKILAAEVGFDLLRAEAKAAEDAYTAAGCDGDLFTPTGCNDLQLELDSTSEIYKSASATDTTIPGTPNMDQPGEGSEDTVEALLNVLRTDVRAAEDAYVQCKCHCGSLPLVPSFATVSTTQCGTVMGSNKWQQGMSAVCIQSSRLWVCICVCAHVNACVCVGTLPHVLHFWS